MAEEGELVDSVGNKRAMNGRVGQEQIQDLLFSEKLSWQAIIYDLINTDQLDPWDLDLVALSNKYLEKIKDLETHSFFVSSKVLLAASLLLRLKSEVLLNRYLPSLDEILFGKTEEKKYVQERIELEDEIPGLIPRTPLPRYRKVSLQELMEALGKAIKTETRRIRRVVLTRQQEIATSLSLPRRKINLKERIREIYAIIKGKMHETNAEKVPFSELAGKTNEEKITTFAPLLHLDSQKRVWLEQEAHFEEIWVFLHEHYMNNYSSKLYSELEAQLEEEQYGNEQGEENGGEGDEEEVELGGQTINKGNKLSNNNLVSEIDEDD